MEGVGFATKQTGGNGHREQNDVTFIGGFRGW